MDKIPQIEQLIFKRMNYSDRVLEICLRYIDDGKDTPTFKNTDLKKIFTILDRKFSNQGNRFILKREYLNYSFDFHFLCRRNITDIYFYIYRDKELFERVDNMNSILRYIPYDKEKADKLNTLGFGLNSLEDLKNYVNDFIDLYDEFVDEYIKEIDAGNV